MIVEKFIESADDEQLRDYKVFCFNGKPKMVRVDTDRFTKHKMDFFDCNWERIPNAGISELNHLFFTFIGAKVILFTC